MDHAQAWLALRRWIEEQDDYHDHSLHEVLDKMDALEEEMKAMGE